MKRLHVHVTVADMNQSIQFYSKLFGAEPSKQKVDYAKWMLEDPRVNFAISINAKSTGLSHLGIQAEDQAELDELTVRAKAAGESVLIESGATCCYARSNKAWVEDPAGLRWETFFTFGDVTRYGHSAEETHIETKGVAATPVAATSCCG